MSTEYSEDLHQRIREAARYPISNVEDRLQKAEVLDEAISHP